MVYVLIYMMVLQAMAIGVLAVSNMKLWIELKAMKQSTHTLTYIDPLQQTFEKAPTTEEQKEMSDFSMDNIV